MTQAAYRMSVKRRASAQTDFKVILSSITIGSLLIAGAAIILPAITRINALIG